MASWRKPEPQTVKRSDSAICPTITSRQRLNRKLPFLTPPFLFLEITKYIFAWIWPRSLPQLGRPYAYRRHPASRNNRSLEDITAREVCLALQQKFVEVRFSGSGAGQTPGQVHDFSARAFFSLFSAGLIHPPAKMAFPALLGAVHGTGPGGMLATYSGHIPSAA